MKHNSLISANGFHTPIASTTVKSSVLTTIFKPLLLLLLLMVGSSVVWGDCTFTQGETLYLRLGNENGNYWDYDGAKFRATFYNGETELGNTCMDGEQYSHLYSVVVPYSNATKVTFARRDPSCQWDWSGSVTMTAEDAGQNDCLYKKEYNNSNLTYEKHGSGLTGCGGVPEPAEREISTDYRLRGDLWVYDDNGNWAGKNNNPELTLKSYRETNGTYTFSYIAPLAPKNRFTVMIGGGADKTASLADGSSSGVTTNSSKYIFDVTSSPKQVDITYYPSTEKAKVLISNYTPVTSGWYFKCESAIGGISANTNTAMAADGTLLLENVAEGTYNFYIHNNASELYWGQNKFGGCYVDQTNSTASLISSKIADKKFDGKQWPIKSVPDRKVKMVVSGSDAGKNVRVSFDGGKIVLTLQDPPTPAATYTVTLHPNNGGSDIERTNVPEGSTTSAAALNLAEVTYGLGTATWYTNPECTAPFSTVTGNMDLYAKWGVSDNYYFASSLQTASDAGETGNWNSGWAKQLNYASGTPGKCSYSFIAPAGRLPFELLTSTSGWSSIGVNNNLINNDASDVTVATLGGHFYFELSAPKKVTVSFDGKVSVNVEDYVFDNSKTWHVKTSWASSGGGNWNYNTVLTNSTNGGSVVLPVEAGDLSFIISTKTDDGNAQQVVGTETFNALYVDTSNPSSDFNWRMTNAKLEGSGNFDKQLPQADGNYWRNCAFHVNANCNIRISFDGGKIRCDILPKYTVSFNSNEGSAVASQTVSEGNTASEPSAPTKDGYTFVKWQLNGSDYYFSNPVTEDITLDAVWAYKAIESVSLNKSSLTLFENSTPQTLTASYLPADVIGVTYSWSVDPTGVVNVVDGVVSVVDPGTATITCTATDQESHSQTATCAVTVHAGEGCEMEETPIAQLTVDQMEQSGMFTESMNTEPEQLNKIQLKIGSEENHVAYVDPSDPNVKHGEGNSDYHYWYLIETGTASYAANGGKLYYLKNVGNGKYLCISDVNIGGGNWGSNYTITADKTSANEAKCTWFFKSSNALRLVNLSTKKSDNTAYTTGEMFLHRYSTVSSPPATYVVTGSSDGNQGNWQLTPSFINTTSVANPDYLSTPIVYDTRSYYRFAQDAAISMTLDKKLREEDKIVVYCYNPSNAARTFSMLSFIPLHRLTALWAKFHSSI